MSEFRLETKSFIAGHGKVKDSVMQNVKTFTQAQ